MRNEIPPPTPAEEKILKTVLEEWGLLTALRRDIAIAVVRGHESANGVITINSKDVATVAAYLEISPEEVRRELPYIHGLLLDKHKDKIRIK